MCDAEKYRIVTDRSYFKIQQYETTGSWFWKKGKWVDYGCSRLYYIKSDAELALHQLNHNLNLNAWHECK